MNFKEIMENKNARVTIFYYNDIDGYASAIIIAAIHHCYYNINYQEITPNSKLLDLSCIDTTQRNIIYILNYPIYSNEEISNLNEFIRKNPEQIVIFIDHHDVSYKLINDNDDTNNAIENRYIRKAIIDHGIISTEVSTSVLCYLFREILQNWYYMLNDKNDVVLNKIRQLPETITDDVFYTMYTVPHWITLIDDYALSKLEFADSELFNLACFSVGLSNVFMDNIYHYLINFDEKEITNFTKELVLKGNAIMNYQRNINQLIMKKSFVCTMVFKFKLEVLDPSGEFLPSECTKHYDPSSFQTVKCNCLCVNGYGDINLFEKEIDKYDAVLLFNYNGYTDTFEYIMYSREVNGFQCNIAALFFKAKYGLNGNGSDHESRWSSPELIFRYSENYYEFTLF